MHVLRENERSRTPKSDGRLLVHVSALTYVPSHLNLSPPPTRTKFQRDRVLVHMPCLLSVSWCILQPRIHCTHKLRSRIVPVAFPVALALDALSTHVPRLATTSSVNHSLPLLPLLSLLSSYPPTTALTLLPMAASTSPSSSSASSTTCVVVLRAK